MLSKEYFVVIGIMLILVGFNFVSASYATSINIYEGGSDNLTYVGDWTTFYANYSSEEGYDLGQVLYRNPSDLGTSYSVAAFDHNGVGNKTEIVFSESDNIRAYYANGTEIWNSYNSQFDYAYDILTGDFNDDGIEEVAFVSSHGELFILNGSDGSVIYESPDYGTGYSIANGDLDDDGYYDDFVIGANLVSGSDGIVAFVYDGSNWGVNWTANQAVGIPWEVDISEVTGTNLVAVADYNGYARVYYADGSVRWASSDRGTVYSITFFDQDADGEEDEIALGESSELRTFTETGIESSKTDPYGSEYEIEAIDLDEDGIRDDILISSNYYTVHAYNSGSNLAWTHTHPTITYESKYYTTYIQEITIGNVNNDSSNEIIVGGYGQVYYILNLNGDIIGKHYYGNEESLNDNDNIGSPYASDSGIKIMNDTNGDGINEIISSRISGFYYIGQQVMCKINISGEEHYMNYNYSSKLWEYRERFEDDYSGGEGSDSVELDWVVVCEKDGYETQSSSLSLNLSLKNLTMNIFDQEDDSEDKAGWLSEDIVVSGENTYFFANWTKEDGSPFRDLSIDLSWVGDVGYGSYFFDTASIDFDGDGNKDGFVYPSYNRLDAYYFDGSLAWTRRDSSYYYSHEIKVGDFDGDGGEEIAGAAYTGSLFILDSNGDEIFQSDDYYYSYSLGVGDINNDSIDDLILGVRDINKGTGNNYGIAAFTWTGSTFVENWVASDLTNYPTEIKVSNLLDGTSLVGVVDYSGVDDLRLYYGNGTLKCQTSDLVSYVTSLEFIDYDGDGDKDEIIMGEYGETYIYNEDCTRNRTDTTSTSIVYEIESIDYDGDGNETEYVFFDRYDLYLMDGEGNKVWNYRLENDLYGSLDVIDINNDGEKEILFTGFEGILYVFNKTGSLLYDINTLIPSQIGNTERANIAYSLYGSSTGFDFADSGTSSYIGFGNYNAYVGVVEVYPRCMIYFNDSVSARMNYNISSELYYYNRSFSQNISYDWNISCESFDHTTETQSSTINLNQAPTYVSISNTPSLNASLDPNETIVVTVNVSEINNNLDSVVMQYKNSTSEWINVSMVNITAKGYYTLYNANFTPPFSTEDIYTYRVWANDTFGVSSYGDNNTVFVYWDCSWEVTEDLGATAGWDENKLVGNIIINNTGDSEHNNGCELNFHLISNLASGRIYFNDWPNNRFLSYYDTSAVPAQSVLNVSINATFLSEVKQEGAIITTQELAGHSDMFSNETSLTLVSNTGGPYLYQTVVSNPISVYLTPGNFTLNSYLRNLMGSTVVNENNTAYNVSFNWILPSGLVNISGNSSINFVNITDSDLYYNNIEVSFSDLTSMNAGVQIIELSSFGYNLTGSLIADANNQTLLTESVNISFLCYTESDGIVVADCGNLDGDYVVPTEDKGGGGGGGGGIGGQSTLFEESSANFEVLRGDVQEFILPIENNLNGYKRNLEISVSGIKSEYISIVPSVISELAPFSSKNVTITITAPSYFTRGVYDLLFSLSGEFVVNKSSNFFRERKEVTLYIVEVERKEVDKLINESIRILDEMKSLELVIDDVQDLFDLMEISYDDVNFLDVKENYLLLKEIYDSAIGSIGAAEELREGITKAERDGIEVIEAKKIMFLAEAAFKRGDYVLAFEKYTAAKLTYALETKGKFSIYHTVKNNPVESLLAFIGFGFFSLGSSLVVKRRYYKRKLKLLDEEEKLLLELMKVVQMETFENNKMSMEEYTDAMSQYEDKLSKTIEEKIMIETKLLNLFKIKGECRALKQEKARLIELIKELQDKYLNKANIETRIYENMMKSYTEKVSDVEGKLTFLEAKHAMKGFGFFGKKGPKLGEDLNEEKMKCEK